MTATGRTLIAVALVGGLVALLITGKASESGTFGLLGIVVGYVFGDRNGEKRTAQAVVETSARLGATSAVAQVVRDVVPKAAASELTNDDPPAG